MESHGLPPYALRCPRCDYDLTGAIRANRDRCSECNYQFTLWELRGLHCPDLEGEPRSLSPHEWRIPGSRLLLILAVVLLALLAAVMVGT
jgi:hypothetical protein